MLNSYAQHLHDINRAPTTIRLRMHYIHLYATHHSLEHATPDQLSRWVHSHGWKPATIQSAIASFRSFYRWAHRTGRLPHNPALELTPPRARRTKARIADEEQITSALSQPLSATHEAWIRLGAECGLRVHEIAKVRVEEIDGEWLHVTGKGGQYRTQWLSPRLRDVLQECARDARHGHLFPGRSGKPVHTSTIWRAFKTLLHTNPHSLRHRAGTTVYRRGGNNIRLAQEFLGHANPMTTARYLHIERDELRTAGELAALAAA